MSSVELELRPFLPGTTGWTDTDLDDPAIELMWFEGRYEIVEGVLTNMPPAFFIGGEALFNLMRRVDTFARSIGLKPRFAPEVDIVVSVWRVARADAAMLMPAESKRQDAAARKAGKTDVRRSRIYVPPTLIIESISPGHEDHDLETKRRWYAEFGVPHYWILDAFSRELLCLRLDGNQYVEDARGCRQDTVCSSMFPGLSIPLPEIWSEE